jgi:hypothetical protein
MFLLHQLKRDEEGEIKLHVKNHSPRVTASMFYVMHLATKQLATLYI